MIDRAFEWLFENHPIIFDMIVGMILFSVSWILCGWISDQITYFISCYLK